MDKTAQEGNKVTKVQDAALTWKKYYEHRREWLTKEIGALENIVGNDKTGMVGTHPSWVLSLYEVARSDLDILDTIRTRIEELKKVSSTLEKRIELLEGESSEQAKQRRIHELEGK
jgi:hypothetical protein